MRPTMTPHSCEICEELFLFHQGNISYFPERGYWERIPEPQFSTGIEYGYWFCLSFKQTVELAEQGCNLMMWLATLGRPDTTPDCQLRAYFVHGSNEQLALDFVNDISDYTDGKDFSRKLVVCADSNDLAATEIKVRPPNLNPASIEAMGTARDWLETCINTHTMCPKPWTDQTGLTQELFERLKPRRLIKICFDKSRKQLGESLRLSLVETTNIPYPKYAALSYCWGGDQPVKLLRSNLATLFKCIPYDELPQTLKDAARVTAEIGLEYLWIDALCIVQDDVDDKPAELARMAEIYSQAQITLLASRSAKVVDGFLRPRTTPSERAFRIPYLVKGEQSAEVILWNGRDLGASEPIDRRAWCFQERVLSNRILEFGTHTTRYRCAVNREAKHSAETDGWIAESEIWSDFGTGSPISLQDNWSSLTPESNEFSAVWAEIVFHYTRLEMSNPADRLNAISGVARRFSRSSTDSYCVGLWRKHLSKLLLWHVPWEDGVKPKSSRMDHYIAPSWSWASITLPIFVDGLASDSIICEVLDISVQNSNPEDCFSNADSATLTIRARTLAATLRWEKPQRPLCNSTPCAFGWGNNCECKKAEAEWFSSDYQCIVLESEVDLSRVRCYCEEPVDAKCNVLLIYITPHQGLIVRQTCKIAETYERIGIFTYSNDTTQEDVWREMDLVLV